VELGEQPELGPEAWNALAHVRQVGCCGWGLVLCWCCGQSRRVPRCSLPHLRLCSIWWHTASLTPAGCSLTVSYLVLFLKHANHQLKLCSVTRLC
jgi:hypothetical protein